MISNAVRLLVISEFCIGFIIVAGHRVYDNVVSRARGGDRPGARVRLVRVVETSGTSPACAVFSKTSQAARIGERLCCSVEYVTCVAFRHLYNRLYTLSTQTLMDRATLPRADDKSQRSCSSGVLLAVFFCVHLALEEQALNHSSPESSIRAVASLCLSRLTLIRCA